MGACSRICPGESHGQRSLVGYSPWGCKDLDETEQLNMQHAIYAPTFWTQSGYPRIHFNPITISLEVESQPSSSGLNSPRLPPIRLQLPVTGLLHFPGTSRQSGAPTTASSGPTECRTDSQISGKLFPCICQFPINDATHNQLEEIPGEGVCRVVRGGTGGGHTDLSCLLLNPTLPLVCSPT